MWLLDLWVHWTLAWLRVADALLEWPAALCNEATRRALELEEESNAEDA